MAHQPESMSGTAETVSVLLRTRDRPILLPRALDDVLSQDFSDWRLIIINDGGDPAPVNRAVQERAIEIAGRATVIHHPVNLGLAAALNAGLARAAGAFFAVHDDDDTWNSAFLDRTVAFLSEPAHAGYAGVATNCVMVHERIVEGVIIEEGRLPWPEFETGVDLARMLVRNRIPPISMLLRRDIVARVGPFDMEASPLEDWEFYLRVLMYADIGTIEQVLAHYHLRPEVGGGFNDNSVVATADQHENRALVLRNRAIRRVLREDPAAAGLLQPLLQKLDEQNRLLTGIQRETHNRLAHLETQMALVHLTAAWHYKILLPFQSVWSVTLPVRRFATRLCRAGFRVKPPTA